MEPFLTLMAAHADWAHWLFFFILLMAGFSFPISEDLIVLASAVVAATVIPTSVYKLFIFVFLGCYLSDWIAYWMGRSLTPWLLTRKWLKFLVNNKRMAKVNQFYDKYGMSTLFFGRFIPFGIRNVLFMSAGMVKMNFFKFAVVDGLSCLISNTICFTLTYSLAENYSIVLKYIGKAHILIFSAFIMFTIGLICYKYYKYKTKIKDTSL